MPRGALQQGAKGGQFYVTATGRKVYVKGQAAPAAVPATAKTAPRKRDTGKAVTPAAVPAAAVKARPARPATRQWFDDGPLQPRGSRVEKAKQKAAHAEKQETSKIATQFVKMQRAGKMGTPEFTATVKELIRRGLPTLDHLHAHLKKHPLDTGLKRTKAQRLVAAERARKN